jgi:hypothetical protein
VNSSCPFVEAQKPAHKKPGTCASWIFHGFYLHLASDISQHPTSVSIRHQSASDISQHTESVSIQHHTAYGISHSSNIQLDIAKNCQYPSQPANHHKKTGVDVSYISNMQYVAAECRTSLNMITSDTAINRPAMTHASAPVGCQASAMAGIHASAREDIQASAPAIRPTITRKQAWSYRIFEICDMLRPNVALPSI